MGRLSTVRPAVTDVFIDQFGNAQTSEVWSIAGKFKHYWLPNLRSNFFAGYQEIEYSGAGVAFVAPTSVVGGPLVGVGFVDSKIFEVGANLIWTPVKQLDIGVEAVYRKVDAGRVAQGITGGTFNTGGAFVAPLAFRPASDDDQIEARLRIQRDF